MSADEHTVFDLIAAINDHRRSLEAAAFGPGDAAHRARCRRQSRVEAMTVAKVTRGIAQRGAKQLSRRELERYVDSLIDAYTDDETGSSASDVTAAQVRKHNGSG